MKRFLSLLMALTLVLALALAATASASASISPRSVSGPKLIRTVPAAVRRSTPMALSTWLTRPLWQADPAEM